MFSSLDLRPHVRQLLLLRRIHVHVARTRILADDHPLVHRVARRHEQRRHAPARFARANATIVPFSIDTSVPRDRVRQRTRPRPVLEEAVVHDARAARVGQELRAVAEQSARRNAVQQRAPAPAPDSSSRSSRRAAARASRSRRRGIPRARRSPAPRTARAARRSTPVASDHARTRHLELVALAPHRLHEDREMQLAAARHRPRVRRVGVLDAQRDVALELLVQPLAQLPRRDELPFLAGERRVVDEEVDARSSAPRRRCPRAARDARRR